VRHSTVVEAGTLSLAPLLLRRAAWARTQRHLS
jgi:hypothetical protein